MSAPLSTRHTCDLLWGSGNIAEYRWKECKGQKPEGYLPGAIGIMNSLQLMMPTLSPRKNNPITSQAWMGAGAQKPYP